MTLHKPTRDEFRAAYKAVAGFDLMDQTIEVAYRLFASIRESRFNTLLTTIEWYADGRVDIRKRTFG